MVLPLSVAHELRAVEVAGPEIPGRVALGFVVEVRRPLMAALPAGGDRQRPHAIPELDHRDEAVAAGPVPLLGPGIGARAERRQRAPPRRRERHRNARSRIVERLDDVAGETLEAIDVTPRRLPRPEIG